MVFNKITFLKSVLLFLLHKDIRIIFKTSVQGVTAVMEYRPNSGPEQKSYDIGPDSHNFPLSEYLTIQRATILWDEPRHTSYNSKTARLRSYVNWPHGMNPSPESLSIAGLFYTVMMKEFCKSLPLYYHSLLRNYSILQVGVI